MTPLVASGKPGKVGRALGKLAALGPGRKDCWTGCSLLKEAGIRFPWLDEKFSMGTGLFVRVSKGTGGGAGELKVSEVRSISVAGSPLGEDAGDDVDPGDEVRAGVGGGSRANVGTWVGRGRVVPCEDGLRVVEALGLDLLVGSSESWSGGRVG